MAAPRRGTIPSDGVLDLLRAFEATRASGLLAFVTPEGKRGEVWLRLGALDPSQEDAVDGSDPVARFLALRGGTYEILDQLPPLDGTMGSGLARSGSLTHHSVADLMAYAESAALSGLVRVESGGRIAEIVYSEGMLGSIYLDGAENDVDALFGWSEGTFVVRANTPPSLAPPTGPAPVVVERALGSLLDEAAQRRPRPPSGAVVPPRQRTLGPPRREATVRIVMLGGRGEALLKLGPRASAPGVPGVPGVPDEPNTSNASAEGSSAPERSPSASGTIRAASVADGRVSAPAEGVPSRPSVARATLPRANDRQRARNFSARESQPEIEPIVPRVVVIAMVVLLLMGIGAFVASLLAIG